MTVEATRVLPGAPATRTRPAVAVVVPFAGSRAEARASFEAMALLRLEPRDELVLVDNTPDRVAEGLGRVVAAPARRSSYHARNAGARATRAEWILFVDADCRVDPDLIERYFAEPVADDVGALAGAVVGVPDQPGLVPRWSRSRAVLDQRAHLRHEHLPFANTSNLLVRRRAWSDVGGFHDGIRSGGDVDFCWRLQEAGWRLDLRPDAVVRHLHRETVRGLVRQMARYAAGHAWLNRRHDGRFPKPRLARRTARALAGAAALALLGKGERSLFRLLDAIGLTARAVGWHLGNAAVSPARAQPAPARAAPASAASAAPAADRAMPSSAASVQPDAPPALRVALVTDRFPELSETFVAAEARALRDAGHGVTVEARVRADRPNPDVADLDAAWHEDESAARRLADLAWLAPRAPVAMLRDLVERRRWREQERWVPPLRAQAPAARRLHAAGVQHLHAHFAMGAALDTLRLARLLGVSWSLTAHAFDIYRSPRNLELKLAEAAFVTSGCEYTVRDLRRLMPAGREGDVHEIVMGIDPERFRRRRPHPGGRTVIAVGRLVEKKGFAHLLEAVARSGTVERLVIVGAGPLEASLRALAASLGIADRVAWEGARAPGEVRDLLEEADLLAMPCVVAGDGDRDSMPVVVKEALAMELPVVCSDEVGLPELVRPEWGRLVPPADPDALAAAIDELLALPVDERAAMGRAGRTFVREFADVRSETAKLARLIEAARS